MSQCVRSARSFWVCIPWCEVSDLLGGLFTEIWGVCLFIVDVRGCKPVTIYHCISGDMRSLTWVYRENVRFLIYWWLYVPGCEVSDPFMELIFANRTAMPIVSVISHDAWCHVSDLFEGAWPTVWSISSIPCVFPSMWGLSPGQGSMSHGVRPPIYLQVYSQDRCSPLSFER